MTIRLHIAGTHSSVEHRLPSEKRRFRKSASFTPITPRLERLALLVVSSPSLYFFPRIAPLDEYLVSMESASQICKCGPVPTGRTNGRVGGAAENQR